MVIMVVTLAILLVILLILITKLLFLVLKRDNFPVTFKNHLKMLLMAALLNTVKTQF